MIKEFGQKLIELEKIKQTRIKVKDKLCDEQTQDINHLFEMVDDLVDVAVTSTTSPMAYQQLQQTKAEFINNFLEIALKYRLLDNE
jgi:hypothetical protein